MFSLVPNGNTSPSTSRSRRCRILLAVQALKSTARVLTKMLLIARVRQAVRLKLRALPRLRVECEKREATTRFQRHDHHRFAVRWVKQRLSGKF